MAAQAGHVVRIIFVDGAERVAALVGFLVSYRTLALRRPKAVRPLQRRNSAYSTIRHPHAVAELA